jgi:hypothetical protein
MNLNSVCVIPKQIKKQPLMISYIQLLMSSESGKIKIFRNDSNKGWSPSLYEQGSIIPWARNLIEMWISYWHTNARCWKQNLVTF